MCLTGLQNSNVRGVVTVLEPTPSPPLSSALGEIQFVGKTPSSPACRIGTPLAAAALIPGPLKHSKEVDTNHLHVSLACECAESDSETAWDPPDRGTSFMFGLFSSEGTSSTYPTSRDETSDAPAGTCPHRHCWALPNFSWRVAVRCDVRRQRFASTAAIRRAREERGRHSFCHETLRADMGVPRASRTDNGTKYSNSMFVDFCDGRGIRREFTAPYTPQQNGPVESAIS